MRAFFRRDCTPSLCNLPPPPSPPSPNTPWPAPQRLKPLVSVAFVTSQASSSLETAECPTDHPENLNDVVFGGVSAGLCTCKSGAVWRDDGRNYFQYSSSGTCNTNQTKADCKSDSSIPAMTLPFWSNGLMVCGRRGGEAAIIGTAPFRERPVPKTTGTPCPTGYRLCGDASEAGEAICFPTSEPLCPISALATVPSSSFRPSDYRNATFFQQADGSWLVASREAGHLPVVNAKAGFRSVCVGQDDPYTYGTSSANVAGRLTVSFGCKGVSSAGGRARSLAERSHRCGPLLDGIRAAA